MSSERDAKSPAFQAIVQALVQHERERARRRLLARYDPQQLLALCEQFGIDTSLDEERRLDQIDLGLTIERGRQFVPRSTEKATKARMRKAEEHAALVLSVARAVLDRGLGRLRNGRISARKLAEKCAMADSSIRVEQARRIISAAVKHGELE